MHDFKSIEKKWQEKWEKDGANKAEDFSKKPKKYFLVEFPYPSGDGLHVGHCRSYAALDILARKARMDGFNVLYPMGWDSFGLPAENYAIKTGKHPQEITKKNTDNFRRQMKSLGFSFDWSREINTTDPAYYKWTQWIFLQMWKKGLAYKTKMSINWCPKDKIGLANEEVADGKCERCGTSAEKKEMEQWMLRITAYADKLLAGLEEVDYPERVKEQQTNWIGRSEGAEINFKVAREIESPKTLGKKEDIEIKYKELDIPVFTTRLDTIYGVSAIVLAPEYPLVACLAAPERKKEVYKYIEKVKKETEIERVSEESEKTGVPLGVVAINPFTGEKVPVWIADYVLANYGTGAVMMVPAHDSRDFAFAKKYGLEIKDVVVPKRIDMKNPPEKGKKIVERKTIHGIVRNPKTGKILCLKWEKFPWTTFVVGGVNDGEDIILAAKREIREETGYLNLEFKKVLGGPVRSEYFAAHKDENRVAITSAVLFELKNEKKEAVKENEASIHECVWMDLKDINYNTMTCSELDIWLKRLNEDERAYVDEGTLIYSGKFSGLASPDARRKMADFAESKKFGRRQINYHLRDWVFSRQHYWGEPIPLVFCEKCGVQPVPEDELPVKLPMVKSYEPTGTGESPLANIKSWVNTKCPKCGGKAKRETDTMPNWAGSSWYYLRYADPNNDKVFADKKLLKYWTPVDIYNGGMEHTTLHLLYSRFWHKFLYDEGLVPASEPYKKRTSHGMVLGEGGIKMSKSRGNVINPDDVVKEYGADTLRIYEMFMGPFSEAIPWEPKSIIGVKRFLDKIWNLSSSVIASPKGAAISSSIEKLLHKTIKGVTEDIDNFKFNTAISKLMILVNAMSQEKEIPAAYCLLLTTLLAPFAPHLSEELWSKLGNKQSIFLSDWPKYDPALAKDEEFELVIQVNGKVRDKITAPAGISEDEAKHLALQSEKIKPWLDGKEVRKIIFTGKLLNIVV